MSKEHKLTAEEWTELYEALQILKAACDACGIETQCLELQSIYMLEHCPIPQPKQMPIL